MQRKLFWLGEYDRWDMYHVKRLIEPGARIFDIGANFGYYALTLSAHLAGECQVFAFEPNPDTRYRLEKNIALNRLGSVITSLPFGVSDAPGMARISNGKSNTGGNYIGEDGEVEVELKTLDMLCSQLQMSRLDFVKIDVEGLEKRVLEGGRLTLKRFSPVMMVEIMPFQLERAGATPLEVFELLSDYGYDLRISQRDRLMPVPKFKNASEVANVICLPSIRKSLNV